MINVDDQYSSKQRHASRRILIPSASTKILAYCMIRTLWNGNMIMSVAGQSEAIRLWLDAEMVADRSLPFLLRTKKVAKGDVIFSRNEALCLNGVGGSS